MSHKITNSTGLVINTHFWHMFQFLKSVGDSLEAVSQYARFFSLLRDAAADVYKLLRPNLQLRDQSSRCVPSLCKRDHCAFDHAIIALGGLRKCRPFTHCPSCSRLQDTHVKWISRPLETLPDVRRRCDQCPCYSGWQQPDFIHWAVCVRVSVWLSEREIEWEKATIELVH